MIVSTFEIKITMLGNVSAGKTTIINALLRDKFGEASMKRTTAGINYVRVHSAAKEVECKIGASVDSTTSKNSWGDSPPTRSAESVLKEIVEDNVKLRNGDTVQEKYFDVQLEEDILEMREDTKLVLVDVPGINEAGVANKYTSFVSEKWDTFDCVIVVMDGKQGVNTEDQIFLLNLVKTNLLKKDIPVIILCNKVDDPDDDEQAELVKEAKEEIESIFEVGCRSKALDELLGQMQKASSPMSPTFIPISAIHAYIHQSASLLSREKFECFDRDLIEKLGREQIGRRRWTRLSEKEKLDEAYKVVTECHQDGIKDSNFDKLISVLRHHLGGNEKQHGLITKQIEAALARLSEGQGSSITSSLRSVHEMSKKLAAPGCESGPFTGDLKLASAFWDAYRKYAEDCFQMFESSWPKGFAALDGPMRELISYHELVARPDWDDDKEKVEREMKSLVRRLFGSLIKRQVKARDANGWENQGHSMTSNQRQIELLPHEWSLIWGSLQLVGGNEHFCGAFAREKMVCARFENDTFHWRRIASATSMTSRCPRCGKDTKQCSGSNVPWCSSCHTIFAPSHKFRQVKCPHCYSHLTNRKRCNKCSNTFSFQEETAISFDPLYNDLGTLCFGQGVETVINIPDSMADPSHPAHTA